ncbi:alpha-1,4-N-acetylglucosaminyltransferase-like isoform X1 [Microcaecilia unicolor]|uniref:Alpha-1,4-N-acetylglucosaminyltransferase-like isoform X1 n=1 Tax=Microcaecilia unicolor TaxID=1415580 RepID=A0A6P7XHW1_9AMPH|nr:alpha-1,4-N-acetylglucosaminyltransferase-like isoform X1 [Microcaecilia unicolor]XP_030050252.1 alpha-1,4-N-acetylglucosaminyltransferase-like isoform X1 [Microcaecilia unicolor]XP_030050253.1 alpha-1,4-N-acetylglucosaminyltransferase-like isoform X1 [Microcaecilia unicolor]XP_030050254.1 alpha-1,4-N-acetylglucosaminyltransferase-like isoform X1 [Microcaecilia unicolor]XP_030050255.1 alpha-1,4-N-acetylglucosaminyltransferase-like isoform X1 [Microcaecilia unicolor]XP_030050256.1 alpha-1,4-
MKSMILCPLLFFFIFACSAVYWMKTDSLWTLHRFLNRQFTAEDIIKSRQFTAEDIIKSNMGIFMVETTEKLELSPLAACAIESAAQTYPDRSVYFFMKGLTKDMTITKSSFYKAIPLLSSIENVYILPLYFEDIFKDTPLDPWYQKVNPAKEKYWAHVSSDAFRLAMVWKYGGIYMDSDMISLRPIPKVDFLALEDPNFCNNAAFGFQRHYQFLWDCMEDFVKNYRGEIWGQQGPKLLTRMVERQCGMPVVKGTEDATCGNFSILNPQRFYPIPCSAWEKYFQVWNPSDTFNSSYALHLWNYMNHNNKMVIAGSGSVAENLFKKHCPVTYDFIVKPTSRKYT